MAISFAKNHIGKSLDDTIVADDLINYFSVEREESLTLEFKSYVPDKNGGYNFDGVLRTIAAFLNSEGGLLIFGAPLDIDVRNGYRVVSGSVTPVPLKAINKDGLVNRISDAISYMPIGIRVESVKIKDDEYIYLVEVQESDNKPHQYNKYYYIRLDGQSKTAPHYLVEALFKQVKSPVLKGYLRITSYYFGDQDTNHNVLRLSMEVNVFNETKNMNDSGVYVQIIANRGSFKETGNDNYIHNGNVVFVKDISPVITYALATKVFFIYEVPSDDYVPFYRDKEELYLQITFGSNNSETKLSEYHISFKNISTLEVKNEVWSRTTDLNSLMSIRKEENISMNNIWQDSEDKRHQNALTGI